MKYSVLVINSIRASDYWGNSADGIRYDNLEKEEVEQLMTLSVKQNFSVIIQKCKEEG